MDWVRRNFPDILIGIALILVVAAIVVTLLNGGSLFPRGRQATSNPGVNLATPATSNPVTRNTPDTTPPPSISSTLGTSNGESGTLINPIPPITSAPSIEVDTPQTAISDPSGISVVPPSSPTATNPVTATTGTTSSGTANSTASVNTNLPSEPYRIGVGAFRSRENADRLADEVRAQGFPVFIANQDELNIVLVGPYTSESEAAQVATRLRNAGRDVTIYEYRPSDDELLAAATQNPTSTATSGTSSNAVTTSSSGRFIQVGAYGSIASSLPQKERLEGLGYTVETVQSGSLYRLLIGPYANNTIEQVQAQLTSQGIDHFVTSGP
jgi:cell division septation protein DedD